MKHWLWLIVFSLVPVSIAQVPVEIVKIEPHSHTRCALAALGTDDKDPWGSCLVVWYKNTSGKYITGIRFDVHFVSALKEVDPAVYSFETTEELKPSKQLLGIWHDGVFWHRYGDGMDAQVQVGRVMFRDGTFWNASSPTPLNPTNAHTTGKPEDQATLRQALIKTIDDTFNKQGIAGYAEISGDKLTVHSERASAVRFNMTLKNGQFLPAMKNAGISTFMYTNDAEENFEYNVAEGRVVSSSRAAHGDPNEN